MTDDARHTAQRTSFDGEAELYDRARPDYPDAAIDWMLPRRAQRVLDLGAGTGKLTGSLVARGLDVVAVDPGERLLATLGRAMPGVDTLVGTAERIPLPDHSVDTIVCAQAWHWVDAAAATREAARVLRPGGTLALVWNIRDESVPWVARLSAVMGSSEAEKVLREDPLIGFPFGRTESLTVPWARPMTVDQLVELALSRSYLITASVERRAEVIDGIRQLVASEPHLSGADFALPYDTRAFRAALSA